MDSEKHPKNESSSDVFGRENNEPYYDNDELNEPPPEDSLHRGLKARQISMIAVCLALWIHGFHPLIMHSWEVQSVLAL